MHLLLIIIALFSAIWPVHVPGSPHPEQWVNQYNQAFEKAWAGKDADRLAAMYDADAVIMPEYHTRVAGVSVKKYYTQWFGLTFHNKLEKKTYAVLDAGDYVLETGTLQQSFKRADSSEFSYKGKYIQVWRKHHNGSLKLVSQIWGNAAWYDKNKLPVIEGVPYHPPGPFPLISAAAKKIDANNRAIADLVKTRNGAAFSQYYTENAIYMPYYSPMIIGRDSIHAYYQVHEDPKTKIDAVSIKMARMINAGNFYITDGYYTVDWGFENNKGRVSGKSINIWEKQTDGKLLLRWQMTNHDR